MKVEELQIGTILVGKSNARYRVERVKYGKAYFNPLDYTQLGIDQQGFWVDDNGLDGFTLEFEPCPERGPT